MIPADWEEYLADAAKDLKRPPETPKRWLPKIKRHQSAEMRRVSGQTKNRIRAIYVPESKYTVTPTRPEDWRGVESEVGPGDVHNNDRHSFGSKQTKERRAGANDGMNRQTPRKRGRGRPSKVDYDALAEEYGD